MTDLDKLEALAKAATQGPWTIDPQNEWDDGTNLPEQVDLRVNGSRWSKVVNAVHVSDADAAFIAAANPATILDLIASARRDAEEIERLGAAVDQAIQCLCTRIPGGVLHGDETMSILRVARAAHTGEG